MISCFIPCLKSSTRSTWGKCCRLWGGSEFSQSSLSVSFGYTRSILWGTFSTKMVFWSIRPSSRPWCSGRFQGLHLTLGVFLVLRDFETAVVWGSDSDPAGGFWWFCGWLWCFNHMIRGCVDAKGLRDLLRFEVVKASWGELSDAWFGVGGTVFTLKI